MKRKITIICSLLLLFCLGVMTVSCKKTPEKVSEKDIYSGTVLLNGFDTVEDMYKVRQHTYMQNNKWTGYSAEGKLQIVDEDNFIPVERTDESTGVHKAEDMKPRQGTGALHINYVSEVEGSGGFTQLIARFARTEYQDIPVDRLGGISVQIYNDNSNAREVTLSLVKSDLSVVDFGGNSVTLAPYSWTECMVDLNPAIVEYFKDDVVGLSVEFDSKKDSVYYLDNLCLTFEQIYTDEIREYVDLVKKLEKDIDAKVVGKTITVDLKEDLSDLFKRYLELPKEYQGIVRNYTDLKTAIEKYMSVVADDELKNTGSMTVLRFDEIFGLTQVGDCLGCSVSYTTEEHAPDEEGSLCVEFDGTTDWTSLFVNPNVAVYDEIHVWIKNDSEFARVFNIDWHTLGATGGAAYDAQGNEITNSLKNVEYANNIIAEEGWIRLVFRDQVGLTHFNMTSYAIDTNQAIHSQGKLYIGKVWATSKVAELMGRIDALEEKSSYTDEELLEILDLYLALQQLSKEQKNILGLDRVEKIENLYQKYASDILNAKMRILKVKDEYSAAEITEVNAIKQLYDALSNEDKRKVNTTNMNRVLERIAGYNENGANMDVTAYDDSYADSLFYSRKEIYSGEKFSVKYQTEIKDGNIVTLKLPEPITNGKRLKIAVKNTSDKTIAFWPKVCDEQGGLWMEPKSHEVVITKDESWVELVYDIEGMTIDSLLATYGPWENGELQLYIGKIEVVTDLSKEVAAQLQNLSSLINHTEFTAAEIRQIRELKELYDGLSTADKQKIDLKKLNELLTRISNYDKSGKNMNVAAYDQKYENVLSYSLQEVLGGELSSMKIATNISNKDAITVPMPETITGKKLTITVKNTSDKDIAFWPKVSDAKGGAWLNPTNHGEQPIIKAEEGWVELTYNIDALSIDALVATYGPWENGELKIYIGKIHISNDGLGDVKDELAKLAGLVNEDEFTVAEMTQILDVWAAYEKLSSTDKKQLDTTNLDVLLEKIAAYDTAGTNMNVTEYESGCHDMLRYSVKEKEGGSNFSIKLEKQLEGAETYLVLPETIYGNKKLTITVKNVSDEDIAIWPKLVDDQGGTWQVPMNHGGNPIITVEEGWVELQYDITDKTIDALVTTLGPWKSGQLGIYIGKIEVTNTFLPDVEAAIVEISELLSKDEFTAGEMQQIVEVKNLYDNRLTEAEKNTLNPTNLLEAVAKIEGYDAAGDNMNITKYDAAYTEMLYYSTKDTVDGADFSLKVNGEMSSGEAYLKLPETIIGKTLSITMKNTSNADIALWPQAAAQGGAWLNPMNHEGQPIIKAEEGWVTLTYSIEGQDIDTLVMTYGPWQSGQIEFYIGEIEVITTYLPAVKAEIDGLADLFAKEEFTATEIERIMSAKESYDSKLSVAEKDALGASEFLAAVERVQYYNLSGNNMDVTKYADDYENELLYSVSQRAEGKNFSLKISKEMGSGEAYISLPETITGAKTLTITLKNASDTAIAFWPQASAQGGAWLNPTNHNANPVIGASEGFVELTYNVNGQNIDTLVLTYGPWASGQLDLYIAGIEISNENGEQLEAMQIASTTGSTHTETTEGIKVDFNGTVVWSDINFSSAITANREIHIFMKNDSDSRRIVSLDWAGATKVYDAEGTDVTISVVDGGNTILPANSGWLEVVYTSTSGSQLNCCSLQGETGGTPINGVGSLYIKGYTTK